MAKLKAEVLHQHYQGRAASAGPSPAGPDLPPEPDRRRDRPSDQRDAPQPGVQMAAGEGRRHRPPADACPRSRSDHFRKWFRAPSGRLARRRRAARSSCSTTASRPTTIPKSGIAAVRVLEASGYRVELAGLACCGRPAISKGLLPWRASWPPRTCGSSLTSAAPGHPDRRLRAELPGDAGRRVSRLPPRDRCRCRSPRPRSWSTRSSPIRRSVPDLPLAARRGPRAGPRPLPAEGGGRDGRNTGRLAPSAGARGQGARLGLLRHGGLVRLRARPLRGERGAGQPRLDPGGARRPRRPSWSRRASRAAARSTAWPGSRRCIRSRSSRNNFDSWVPGHRSRSLVEKMGSRFPRRRPGCEGCMLFQMVLEIDDVAEHPIPGIHAKSLISRWTPLANWVESC